MANRRLRQTRGYGLGTVTGTLALTDFSLGDTATVRVNHYNSKITGETAVMARFADCPYVQTSSAPGFKITMRCDGTDGTQFLLDVEYLGTEYTVYGYPEEDIYVYPYGEDDDTQSETGTGDATITWTRTGVLADTA